jgi:hypothetical protein
MGDSMAGRIRYRAVFRPGMTGIRRARDGRGPGCEALEARTVLSAAISGGFLSPTSAVVAKAQAVVNAGAAAEFSRYQADLQKAEASSRVTPAAFANLKADASSLEAAIETGPLTSQAVSQDLVALQDIMDQSFLEASNSSSQWNAVSQEMGQALYGVVFTTNLPNQAFADMQTVAKEARVTPAERRRLQSDEQALMTALGPNVQTALGGSVSRDPVVVYYDGQITQFVHKR